MDMHDVKSAAETLAGAFEEYKVTNDQRLAELERKGSADVVLSEKLSRLDSGMTKLQDEISKVKTVLRRPALSLASKAIGEEDNGYKSAFVKYITKGHDHELNALLIS